MRHCLTFILLILSSYISAQDKRSHSPAAIKWADSIYRSLTPDQRIAQLMVVRLSTIDSRTKKVTFYDKEVSALINKYNIGGICVFQGSPVQQANIINSLQAQAKTPILMCIDAEWGVGMRITDSVLPLPKQMMLGAMSDESIMYRYGQVVADQCKRLGLHVNYAPVVDVNNNPNNPVINDRSFGEDKYKVASFAIQYINGMEDNGVMACAKHFPGHGDVSVDSHYDLPVINKTMAQLDSLELYPFREVFKSGVGSAMMAHLYIPAIDKTANRATSLSRSNVTDLLRNKMGFDGLTFTDALEMKGVSKFFPGGETAVQSIIAGNDMLCLPEDVPTAITKIKEAIKNKRLSWKAIEHHCKKVLMAKYEYGLNDLKPINTINLTEDLNRDVLSMRRIVAENAITLLNNKDHQFFPLTTNKIENKIAYVGIGITTENAFAERMKRDYNASVYYPDLTKKSIAEIEKDIELISKTYNQVVIGIHNINRTPANNFGISKLQVDIVRSLSTKSKSIIFLFGNAYAAKNWCNADNIVVCYEDDATTQETAADMLAGKLSYKGTLPVTVCDNWKYGDGINTSNNDYGSFNSQIEIRSIDSIVTDAISKKAMPGCVVLVAKDGVITYNKAYGNFTYDAAQPMTEDAVFDLASITKICATTLAVMKLYDEGKIELKTKLSDYLRQYRGTKVGNLSIDDLLLHQAGLIAYIPFYKETLDAYGMPLTTHYTRLPSDSFSIKVANELYLRNDWKDTMLLRIAQSPMATGNKYIYSDNDFIYLGMLVEEISGMKLNEYVRKHFYLPMGLASTRFNPAGSLPDHLIVPTENDIIFRKQLLKGTVHDQGAAMFGGIAGHAGLFSNARDLACLMQMLLNQGIFNGIKYLEKETVTLFTSYNSNISRRGYGFDKPEKDNQFRNVPYPSPSSPTSSFGHTGYTGTAAWADPDNNMIFIFLSNRVHPDVNNRLQVLNVRSKVQEAAYATFKQ